MAGRGLTFRSRRLDSTGGQVAHFEVAQMNYQTLLVHLELGHSNADLLRVVGDIADRFKSAVIGIAACEPAQNIYGGVDIYSSYVFGDLVAIDHEEIRKQVTAAEAEFRGALEKHSKSIEWRSAVMSLTPSSYVATQARCADLLITKAATSASLDAWRHANTTDLIMEAGRPVLIVPLHVDRLGLERIVVAWKDTREARRAALDALPFLKLATHVAVVEIAPEAELASARVRVRDVVGWLKQHDVVAEAIPVAAAGANADQLNEIVNNHRADLIVAGAYGHSRFREWALGGVTRDLLLGAEICSLVSR